VRTLEDGFLAEFASGLDAVKCACDIQEQVRALNRKRAARDRIRQRVGIHLGNLIGSGTDILGDAVNVASRIESLAPEGGISLSWQVYDPLRNKFELPIKSVGKKRLKHVGVPVKVYRIVLPWEGKSSHARNGPTSYRCFQAIESARVLLAADSFGHRLRQMLGRRGWNIVTPSPSKDRSCDGIQFRGPVLRHVPLHGAAQAGGHAARQGQNGFGLDLRAFRDGHSARFPDARLQQSPPNRVGNNPADRSVCRRGGQRNGREKDQLAPHQGRLIIHEFTGKPELLEAIQSAA
jgi:hypothetical protein